MSAQPNITLWSGLEVLVYRFPPTLPVCRHRAQSHMRRACCKPQRKQILSLVCDLSVSCSSFRAISLRLASVLERRFVCSRLVASYCLSYGIHLRTNYENHKRNEFVRIIDHGQALVLPHESKYDVIFYEKYSRLSGNIHCNQAMLWAIRVTALS